MPDPTGTANLRSSLASGEQRTHRGLYGFILELRGRVAGQTEDKRCVCAERAQQLTGEAGIPFSCPQNAEVVPGGELWDKALQLYCTQKTEVAFPSANVLALCSEQ